MIHVYPTNDLREHQTDCDGECWCEPEIQFSDPITGEHYKFPVCIHNAADGREDGEGALIHQIASL